MNMVYEFSVMMAQGGPIMWVIFGVACIALGLLVWEALKLRTPLRHAREDYRRLHQSNSGGLPDDSSTSPLAGLLAGVRWQQVQTSDDLARELHLNLTAAVPRLEGSLPTIAILGSLLPMLGLLGTVTGMINVFEVIALHGSGQPDLMADGISQALLTTASGLVVAIPVIFLHHLLTRRLQALLGVTHQSIPLLLARPVAPTDTGH